MLSLPAPEPGVHQNHCGLQASDDLQDAGQAVPLSELPSLCFSLAGCKCQKRLGTASTSACTAALPHSVAGQQRTLCSAWSKLIDQSALELHSPGLHLEALLKGGKPQWPSSSHFIWALG